MLPHQELLKELLTQFKQQLSCLRCDSVGSMSPVWDNPYLTLQCHKTINGRLCHAKLGESHALSVLQDLDEVPSEQLESISAAIADRRRRRRGSGPPTEAPPELTPAAPSTLELLQKQMELLLQGMQAIKLALATESRERLALQAQVKKLESTMKESRTTGRIPVVQLDTDRVTDGAPQLAQLPVLETGSGSSASTQQPSTYANALRSGAAPQTHRQQPVPVGQPPARTQPPAARRQQPSAILSGLLESQARPPTRFAYLFVRGIRRQPIKSVRNRLRALGLRASRLALSFLDDSTTLSICLPEHEKEQAIDVLNQYNLPFVSDEMPENITAIDARRFASLPDDKRIALAKKRTEQQFRRLALNCRVVSVQRFLCDEIRRMGGTAPTQRERQAARNRQDARQALRQLSQEDPDGQGWTTVHRRGRRNRGPRTHLSGGEQGNSEQNSENRLEGDNVDMGDHLSGWESDGHEHLVATISIQQQNQQESQQETAAMITDGHEPPVPITSIQQQNQQWNQQETATMITSQHEEEDTTMMDTRRESQSDMDQQSIQKRARLSTTSAQILIATIGAASAPAPSAQ